MLNYSMKLVTTDEKKTDIAEYHRVRHILEKQKAQIKVQLAGMGVLDCIVLTFVFAETKRREQARRARSSGGG